MHNTLRPPVPASCDKDWRSLMEQCWAADPGQRPTFTQIASQLNSMYKASQTRASSWRSTNNLCCIAICHSYMQLDYLIVSCGIYFRMWVVCKHCNIHRWDEIVVLLVWTFSFCLGGWGLCSISSCAYHKTVLLFCSWPWTQIHYSKWN